MKILAFTDFHGNVDAFQKARLAVLKEKPDLVLVAGDLVNHDIQRAKELLAVLAEGGGPVYFVPGNMDNKALKDWTGSANVRGLHGRCYYVADLALVGLGGSPQGAFSTPFEFSEQQAAKLLETAMKNYHGGRLILVSHCPPRDTKIDRTTEGDHIGSATVRRFVESNQPVLVLSGHVHEAQGYDTIGSTMVVNTGPAKNGNYVIIKLDQKADLSFAKFT